MLLPLWESLKVHKPVKEFLIIKFLMYNNNYWVGNFVVSITHERERKHYPSICFFTQDLINWCLTRFINNSSCISLAVFGSESADGRGEHNPFHSSRIQTGFEEIQGSFDCRFNDIWLHITLLDVKDWEQLN